jgi:hypothetical protein
LRVMAILPFPVLYVFLLGYFVSAV